ncbi:MAG: shikimate dehydrogenase, partial [Candidatus Dadabacteria bacterium]|nr:shikimate dehydrogenase [Candidatus Dadabacteria bacterium]
MQVKATTKIYGIFGHPVSHSLSPLMHNSAFAALGLDCVYTAFDVHPDDIARAADAIRALGISGVNVTIPHKQAIMPHLDEVSPDAKHTGAVNTVKNEGGRLTGYNTDVGGFMRDAREELGISPEGASILLLGAGGAARAVISAFGMNGAKRIAIANRTPGKAEKLAEEFGRFFPDTVIYPVDSGDAGAMTKELGLTDLLVNSTSGGMEGASGLEINIGALRESAAVYDL